MTICHPPQREEMNPGTSQPNAGFYRRFIKDFSKISKPLSNLLVQEVPFKFDDQCTQAFLFLKKKLVSAPIVVAPNWDLPFE